MSRFIGTREVDGETVEVDDWLGNQSHNWGAKHPDEYAWGQVSGLDGEQGQNQDIFLELITARVKMGPTPLGLRSPWLRIDGE